MAADDAFTHTVKICEDLASQDPTNAEWKHKLADSWREIGQLRQLQGNLEGAAAASTRAAQPPDLEQMLTETFSDFEQRRLWKKKGHSLKAQGNLDGAAEAFLRSLDASQRLANQDESDTDLQLYLAESWQDLGEVREAQGDLQGAAKAFERRLAICNTLLATDPDNAHAQSLIAARFAPGRN